MSTSMGEAFILARLGYQNSPKTENLVIDEDFQYLEDIQSATELAIDIASNYQDHFSIKYISPKHGCKIEYTPIGYRIKGQIGIDWVNIKQKYKSIELNPALKGFTDKIIEENTNTEIPLNQFSSKFIPADIATSICHRLNSIGKSVYEQLNTLEQKNAMANFKRSAIQNFDSCADQVASLLDNRAKILVLRIDIYASSSLEILPDKLVELCINKLINQLRQSRIVPNVLDYICKREFGVKRDIHYHLMVFMDGDAHQQDINFATMIGRKWIDICKKHGQGLVGTFYNCNLHKDRYMRSGIGIVHYADHHKVLGLRKAIAYITKPDFFIRYVTENGTRNLRKGIHPDRKKANQRGVPRKSPEMSKITRLILTTRDDSEAMKLSQLG